METQESRTDRCRDITTVMAQPTQLTAKPSILSLPPEVRREVYRYVLVSHHSTIELRVKRTTKPGMYWRSSDDWDDRINRAILRTCRLIYEEALSVFYEQHTFSFECRWNIQGECRTFNRLRSDHSFKSLRHLELDINRSYDSRSLLRVDIEATLGHVETFGCSLSTLRLRFLPTGQVPQTDPSQDFQTEEEVIERISNQIYRLGVKEKIEIEFTTCPDRKAGCEQIQGFVDAIAASKKWKSRKTTIVYLEERLKAYLDIGAGILIDDPFSGAGGGIYISFCYPIFGIAYGETDEIVVNEEKIVEYKWKWLLQEKP